MSHKEWMEFSPFFPFFVFIFVYAALMFAKARINNDYFSVSSHSLWFPSIVQCVVLVNVSLVIGHCRWYTAVRVTPSRAEKSKKRTVWTIDAMFSSILFHSQGWEADDRKWVDNRISALHISASQGFFSARRFSYHYIVSIHDHLLACSFLRRKHFVFTVDERESVALVVHSGAVLFHLSHAVTNRYVAQFSIE